MTSRTYGNSLNTTSGYSRADNQGLLDRHTSEI